MAQPLTTGELLALLAAAAPRIGAITDGVALELLHAKPQPDVWPINDVLAHLRSCSDVWGGCIATILAEDSPKIKAVNPTSWIERTNYRELDFRSSFEAYTTQRDELLASLQPLPPEVWERFAIVSVAGKPYERTVYFYARWLATHERSHLKQLDRTLKDIKAR